MAVTLPALPVDLGQIDLLTPSGTAQRTDKPLLLKVLRITRPLLPPAAHRLATHLLRMARIVPQRHEYLPMPQPPRQNVAYGDPAGIAVLVAKTFEDPLRGMPLLPRPTLILRQDAVNDPGELIQLRT